MEVKSIEAIGVKYRFGEQNAYGMARGITPERGSTIVIVKTDDGITGIGEAWGSGAQMIEQVKALSSFYIGKDPFDREVILQRTLSNLYHMGRSGPHVSALSGIDMALWDIVGKASGQPVCKLLGGQSREKIMAYASTGYIRANPSIDILRQEVEKSLELGFRALKLKIGINPTSDRERVKLVREMAGDDFLIMVDANGNYTREAALRSAEMMEEFDIHWYEEPLSPEDIEGYRYLKAKTSIPLATGEALFTRHGFRPYIAEGLVDYVQPDLSKCGGISEGKKIIDLAQAWNLKVSAHVWGTAIGIAASLQLMAHLPSHPHTLFEPSPVLFEYDISENPLRTRLVDEPLTVKNGFLEIPMNPGFGVEMDEEFVLHFKKDGDIHVLSV